MNSAKFSQFVSFMSHNLSPTIGDDCNSILKAEHNIKPIDQQAERQISTLFLYKQEFSRSHYKF